MEILYSLALLLVVGYTCVTQVTEKDLGSDITLLDVIVFLAAGWVFITEFNLFLEML